MGGNLSNNDHDVLSRFLDVVLDYYKDGYITQRSAHTALTEALQRASSNDGTVVPHMQAFLSRNPRDEL